MLGKNSISTSQGEGRYKFHFSFYDLETKSNFLSGANVFLEQKDWEQALQNFKQHYPNTSIEGINVIDTEQW